MVVPGPNSVVQSFWKVRMEGKRRRHLAAGLFALSFVLGVTSKGLAGTDGFTTIDFPGATFNSAIGINSLGDIVGQYNTPGRVHGYLWREGEFASIDFPGATFSLSRGITPRGDIVGQYANPKTRQSFLHHGYLLSSDSFTTFDFPRARATNCLGIDRRRRST